ncbi:MAG TPA: ABC transporter substrate-binding protein, partial [Syntrophobacteraceae bacterium]|nr:ABC transporter substrate-binding protein [Syntrophobacteraceae bacterium]
ILTQALKGTDGNRDKIRDNIEKLSGYVGVSGTFNFSPKDHNGLGEDAFVMVRIQKG